MRTFKVDCPEELNRQLRRLSYEVDTYNGIVDRFVDRHLNDPAALDSPVFERNLSKALEKSSEYELAKERVTTEVIPGIQGHDADWSLDFASGVITVTVRCDCPIPGIEG